MYRHIWKLEEIYVAEHLFYINKCCFFDLVKGKNILECILVWDSCHESYSLKKEGKRWYKIRKNGKTFIVLFKHLFKYRFIMLRSNNNKMFNLYSKNLGKLLHVNRTMHLKNNKEK